MKRQTPGGGELQTRHYPIIVLTLALLVLVTYVTTVPHTNTWWFGSSYKLAAVTFGIHFPPGSLILTMLGWLVVQLPLGISEAFALNLFASVLGVVAYIMVVVSTIILLRRQTVGGSSGANRLVANAASDSIRSSANAMAASNRGAAGIAVVVAGLTGLVMAYGVTTWRYAIEFMPYILTAVFTTLILWAILNWWVGDTGAGRTRWLFIIMLLFGLDLSVHRTNLLLLPAFVLWVLVCAPGTFARLKNWLAGGIGLFLGLAFQLLTIPIAARDPIVNASDPSNWPRFYYYLSLQQYGGGWLVNMWPRRAAFWDVQVGDYLRVFADNFVSYGGVLALVPLFFALVGVWFLWRRDWKLTVGLLLLFLASSLGAVVYFNLPEGMLYPMDRHYMPSFVIFALLAAFGAGAALLRVWTLPGRIRVIAVGLCVLLAAALPVKQLIRNFSLVDGSNNTYARDYASNILGTVEPDAIVFVAGDHFHVVSYLQVVENIRPDVITLNPSLCNTGWYVRQTLARHPEMPLTFTEEELSELAPMVWTEKTIHTAVRATPEMFDLPADTALPDTFDLVVPPTMADRYILAQDLLMIKMIEQNQWRRPIYFTQPPPWLAAHTRLEGLVYRLVPQDSAALNADLLRRNLFDRYRYRGYADSSAPLDRFSQLTARQLVRAFCELARYETDAGNLAGCTAVRDKLAQVIPLDRIDPPDELRQTAESLCTTK